LVLPVLLLRLHHLDARVAERAEQIVQLLGRRRDVGGQHLADLVVQEVTLLLADRDQMADFVVLVFDGHVAVASPARACGLPVVNYHFSASICCMSSFFLAQSASTRALSAVPLVSCKWSISRSIRARSRSRRSIRNVRAQASAGAAAPSAAWAVTQRRSSSFRRPRNAAGSSSGSAMSRSLASFSRRPARSPSKTSSSSPSSAARAAAGCVSTATMSSRSAGRTPVT